MRPRAFVFAAIVVAAAAMCVRLGFWQLHRLAEKKALNARMRTALALPPVAVDGFERLPDSLIRRRVRLAGTFDERHQVLIGGTSHEGEPGVHVVTPLRAGAAAVLVDRGWLPAADGVTARPQDFAVAGPREVTGIADTLTPAGRRTWVRAIEADSVAVWSVEALGFDSLSAHMPYPLARFVVRELPLREAPRLPAREAPEAFDESMHVSYSIQWFTFAVILLVGPAALAWSRRRR